VFFEKEILSIKLIDALELTREALKNRKGYNSHATLSFRYDADSTVIKWSGEKLDAKKGSVTFIPKGLEHTISSKSDREILIHFEIIGEEFSAPESFIPLNPHKHFQLFKRLLSVYESKKDGYVGDSTALLYQILAECYKERKSPQGEHPILGKGLTYIKDNLESGDISIKEAARLAGISEVYFRRVFGKIYGISPKKYIINARIDKARELITTGYYSLPKIAQMCGFSDYKHFCTEFKRLVGTPPSKYGKDRL
jgi:AraC-like DNA-binding protein